MNMANSSSGSSYGALSPMQQHLHQQHVQQYQQQQQHQQMMLQHQQHHNLQQQLQAAQQQLPASMFDDHMHYMEAREYLPEFRGQIPTRKKTATAAAANAADGAEPKPLADALESLGDADMLGAKAADKANVSVA